MEMPGKQEQGEVLGGESQRKGEEAAPETCSTFMGGHLWRESEKWALLPCLELWEFITCLERKIWAKVCIPTQIIACSTLSVKLWRPPLASLYGFKS